MRTEILWGDEEKAKFEHGMMREIDFFNFMFPVDFIQLMVDCTNGNLVAQNLALTSVGEMYRMLGVKLAMALEGRPGLNVDFWGVQQDASTIYRPHKYGERFGMSKTRFDHLLMCWALDHSTAHLGGQGLGGILTLLNVFNRRREGCMRPGNLLCINESYTSWSGWPRSEAPTWLFPTYSTWSRLDVQRHSQLKSCVDANTGIVLRLEFAESEHVLSQKAAAQHCSAPTGLVLRLTEPWHKKEGRIVAVNRGMASVECLKACEQVGLKFIGSIKQNNLGYPKSHFDKFEAETSKEMSRGAMKVLTSPYRLPNEPEDRLHFRQNFRVLPPHTLHLSCQSFCTWS
ncbi:hypothetical protein EON64_21050 [archaeon]|nr:MAG: hypothetical protein EON64_21050 [archaeon]